MNKLVAILSAFLTFNSFSQSYAPPANNAGTTAMANDSSAFVAWATGIDLKRGFLNAADTNFTINGTNKTSFGSSAEALNQAQGNSTAVVSLGDGGIATLTFTRPIMNGPGPDFAVFENSFQSDFLELAFVEVSSDGIHFFRFPTHSEVSFATQVGLTGLIDCRRLNNFAGKYEQGYGTPFDLSDLPVDALLDDNAITHVRIIDVIGSINPAIATYDSQGNIVNDPYPTAFATGGFDLDGVGVIHEKPLGMDENEILVNIYPNPATGVFHVNLEKQMNLRVLDLAGKILISKEGIQNENLDLTPFGSGIYLIEFSNLTQKTTKRIVVR